MAVLLRELPYSCSTEPLTLFFLFLATFSILFFPLNRQVLGIICVILTVETDRSVTIEPDPS